MAEWVSAATKWHIVKTDIAPGRVETLCGLTLDRTAEPAAAVHKPRCRKCVSLRP